MWSTAAIRRRTIRVRVSTVAPGTLMAEIPFQMHRIRALPAQLYKGSSRMSSHIPATACTNPAVSTQPLLGYWTWFGGSLLLVALSAMSSQNLSVSEIGCSGLLLAMSIGAYLSWRKGNEISVPVWAMVCAAHFVFYGLPIFGALRKSPSTFDRGRDLPDWAISAAMLVGAVGVCSKIGRAHV